MGPMKSDVDKSSADTEKSLESIRNGQKLVQAPVASSVKKTVEIYLPVRKIPAKKSDKGDDDPALRRQITMNRTFVSAQDFAERVTGLTGLLVNVQPDVLVVPASFSGAQLGAGAAPGGLPPVPTAMGMGGMANTLGVIGAPGYTGPGSTGFPLNLSFNGTVAGLLDVACSRMGVSWEMRDGQVKLFRNMSKTFRLTALPGDTSMNAAIGNSSAAGSTAGAAVSSTQSSSSAQTAGVNFAGLSVWKGIEDSIKSMLSLGGKVVVAPALGTITVTDAPTVVAEVERFIEKQNASLGQQVVVNVRVLAVDVTRSENYGINWDVVYSALSQNFGWAFKSAFAPITGAAALTATVLNTAGGSGTPTIQSWRGSQAIIEALSKQGKVSALTSASITTLNNQPSPLQVGRQTSYLASSQTSISTGVSTTSLTPGMVSTGFSMTLVPHVIDSKKMLLQYAIDMSSLIALTSVVTGGSTIQTPDIDSRTSIQRVMVSSGETIVVTGFENNAVSVNSEGIIDAEKPLAGGLEKGSRTKSTIVILIQPVLLSDL
jgi:type IVB pilus formation R64 PilN family outer membrane protein